MGTNYEQIANEVDTSYRFVCNIGNILRASIHDYLQNFAPNRKLGGVDVGCEINETEHGGKKKNPMGKETNIKLDCSGVIQWSHGKIILQPFQKPGKEPGTRQFGPPRKDDVLPLIQNFVHEGSKYM